MRAIVARRGAAAMLVALAFFAFTRSPLATAQQTSTPRPELVLQAGHGLGTLWHVALSADGALLASGGRGDNAVHVWDTASGRQLRLLDSPVRGQKLNSGVSAIAFGGGARAIAAGFTDGSIAIWDVTSGRELGRYAARTAVATPFPVGVTAIWFDPSSDRVYAGGDPAGVRVFAVSSAREEPGIAGAPTPQFWAPQAVTRDGKTIVSLDPAAKGGEAVVLQDAVSGKATKKRIPGPPAPGRAVVATTDGRVLVASTSGDAIQITDVMGGKDARTLKVPGGKLSQGFVVLAADGRVALASGSTVSVWAADGSTPVFTKTIDVPVTFADAAGITAVDFSGDGGHVATATLAGTTVVFETASGRETSRLRGDVNVPYSVGFSADGAHLYAGARTSWNFAAGQGEKLVAGSTAALSAVSGDGRILAIGEAGSGTVNVWDTAAKRQIATLAGPGPFEVGRLAVSRDGTLVAVSYLPTRAQLEQASRDAAKAGALAAAGLPITVWDATRGKERRTLTAAVGAGRAADTLQFSPDGRQLAVTFMQAAAPIVFDIGSGKEVATLAPAASQVDPAEAIRKMMGGSKRKIDPKTAERIEQMLGAIGSLRGGRAREIGSAAYSPDGRFVAIGVHETAGGGAVEIWDIAAGNQVASIPGREAGTAHVLYSRDGKAIITAGYDNVISLSDAATGKEIRTVGRSAAGILSMAASPNGRLLATTHSDGATRLWDIAKGEQVATLLSLNDGGDWLAVTPDGLFDGSPNAWNTILWRFSANTFDVAPVEIFFNEYYYPDLLSDVLAGKRPRAVADIATRDRRQAKLALAVADVAPGAQTAERGATVRVHVADAPAGASDLRLFRNGSLVKIWHGDTLQGRSSADFEVKVPLLAGRNHFTAYAFNRDNIKSRDAAVDVTGAPALARQGVAYVLTVGINEYENADYNLRYAVADAKSFAADVKAQLERLGRFQRVDVTSLVDRDATKAAIMKRVADLAARVQPEDEVFVFVASHGAAAGDRFYLIPSDLGYLGKRAELDEKAVETILAHSISDQEIETAFEPMNVNRLLFVIDACNSGQALEAEEKRRGPMNVKGLAQLAYEKGMYVLTASQSYQAAQEVSELGHGLLTYALVTEGLDKGTADADPPDGRLVAREWLDYASGRVPRLQVEKMEEARKAGRQLRFSGGPRGDMTGTDMDTQHPRVFYRRELDDAVWIVSSRR